MPFFEGRISRVGFEEGFEKNDFFFVCTNEERDLGFHLPEGSEDKLKIILTAFENECKIGIDYDDNGEKVNSRFVFREFFVDKPHIKPKLSLDFLMR